MGGLKGAGDNAVENIILERKQKGAYTDVFDFIKKVNQRAVNKKSLETLAYGGAFDCFTQFHRAQYFYLPEGEKTTGIEKMIAFGQATTQQETGNNNTLFGDLPNALDVPVPKIPNCEPWTLTEQLEHEKEVTGMFLSGHPLDHFRFELRHYGIMSLIDFNEFKDSVTLASSNQNRNFRIAGLVIDVQHRVTKTGKNFGSFVIEDFSSKTDFILWSEDYVKFQNYLEKGQNILINGYFRSRFNKSDQFEFKITTMCLLETVKQALTKNVEISINPVSITPDFVNFFEKNIKNNPGKAGLKFNIYEPVENLKVTLLAFEKGFEMNEEMADFLLDNPDLEVKVGLVG